ncbi:hypothetical protein LMG28727_05066 [Paraburkholderia kirstenboschensis]|nr:hypothetical protein LMG28727_05066 [Paraburkholderia kirstenboschensis]
MGAGAWGKGRKSGCAARGTLIGTFFWQTPMVQRFAIVCTATCAAGWRNMPTGSASLCFDGVFLLGWRRWALWG